MRAKQQTEVMAALVALVAAEDCMAASLPGSAEHLVSVAKLKLVNTLAAEFAEPPERVLMTVGAELARLRRREHPCAVLDHALTAATGGPLQ